MAVLLTGIVIQACGDNTNEASSPAGAGPTISTPQTTTTTQPQTTTTTRPTTITTTTQPPTTTTTQSPTTSQPPPEASAIYSEYCAACHGDDLEGGIGPALGPGGHATHHSVEELTTIVTSGQADMPAFGETLPLDEIASVIAYVREIQGFIPDG
jgi:cytochrome c5